MNPNANCEVFFIYERHLRDGIHRMLSLRVKIIILVPRRIYKFVNLMDQSS